MVIIIIETLEGSGDGDLDYGGGSRDLRSGFTPLVGGELDVEMDEGWSLLFWN